MVGRSASRQRFLALALASLPAVLVVVGLLTTPAYCRCGAELPHAHALFELPGHRHAAAAQGRTSHLHQHELSTRVPDEVEKVQGWPTVLGWGSTLALWVPAVDSLVLGRLAPPFASICRLAGHCSAPSPPPPRLAVA